MPDKNEKERRKQILADLKNEARQDFETRLPMNKESFRRLFDYLDTELTDKACDNTNNLTKTFLVQSNIQNVDKVLEWLAEQSGYCDCEILANVEEQFD